MKFKNRPKHSTIEGQNFVKLQAGQSIEGIFRGDPYDFIHHWPKGGERTRCTGDGCHACAAGQRRNFRFFINFVTKENAVFVCKVLEGSGKTYDELAALQKAGYDLEKTLVKITRSGNGKDTVYHVLPKPNGILTEAQEAVIAAVKLIDFSDPSANEQAAQAPSAPREESFF